MTSEKVINALDTLNDFKDSILSHKFSLTTGVTSSKNQVKSCMVC